eukprot:7034924-Alexandrium_andersonii.AAC.1
MGYCPPGPPPPPKKAPSVRRRHFLGGCGRGGSLWVRPLAPEVPVGGVRGHPREAPWSGSQQLFDRR